MISSKMVANNLILMPVKIFFVLTTIMGIVSISLYFFKEQERYLNLLRCIGFSKKKSRKIITYSGIFYMVKFLDYFKCCVNIGVTIITIYIVFFVAILILKFKHFRFDYSCLA